MWRGILKTFWFSGWTEQEILKFQVSRAMTMTPVQIIASIWILVLGWMLLGPHCFVGWDETGMEHAPDRWRCPCPLQFSLPLVFVRDNHTLPHTKIKGDNHAFCIGQRVGRLSKWLNTYACMIQKAFFANYWELHILYTGLLKPKLSATANTTRNGQGNKYESSVLGSASLFYFLSFPCTLTSTNCSSIAPQIMHMFK
jgi:hypothetical protein